MDTVTTPEYGTVEYYVDQMGGTDDPNGVRAYALGVIEAISEDRYYREGEEADRLARVYNVVTAAKQVCAELAARP